METLEENLLGKRLLEICKARHMSCKDLAAEVGIKSSTFQKYTSGTTLPSAEVFLGLHEKIGINLDWFADGVGEMYRANRADQVRISYSGNGVAVHQNNGSIGVADASAGGGRSHRICEFVQWWMENRSADDQAWLEQQLARAVPEYLDWKKGAGR